MFLAHYYLLCCCSFLATNMNEGSSRSHCIVTVTVERTHPDGTVQMGKLCMVDLAGRCDVSRGLGLRMMFAGVGAAMQVATDAPAQFLNNFEQV